MELLEEEKRKIRLEENYRFEVRKALEKTKQTSSAWERINSPIMLWVLSSIVLTGLTTMYSYVSESNQARAKEVSRLNVLVVEAISRIEPMRLHAAIVRGEVSKTNTSFGIIMGIDGIYPEFNSRDFRSITFEIASICSRQPEANELKELSNKILYLERKDDAEAAAEIVPILNSAEKKLSSLKRLTKKCS